MARFLFIFSLLIGSTLASAQKMYSCNQAYEADLKVYVVNQKYEADLCVYRAAQKYEAVEKSMEDILKRFELYLSKYNGENNANINMP